jgi:hypothetical protein
MSLTDLDRFKAACVYPGKLDEQAVERELAAFLQALGVRRRVVRLHAESRPAHNPPLNRNIAWILAVGQRVFLVRRLGVADFGVAQLVHSGDVPLCASFATRFCCRQPFDSLTE